MTETRYLFWIKMVFLFILTFTVIDRVYALELSEIEQNPDGSDSGNEWVELYSEEEVDLEGYYLLNGKGKQYNLTGNFSGYFVFSMTLVNNNESVELWKGEDKIEGEYELKDSKDDGLSWSKCDDEWIFVNSTKDDENACDEENENEDDSDDDSDDSDDNDSDEEDNDEERDDEVESFVPMTSSNNIVQPTQTEKKEKIVLNSAPTEQVETQPERVYSGEGILQKNIIYAFAGFCVLLIILLSLKTI